MGCGGSRFDDSDVVLPHRLRPLFLYRLEEIKKLRHTRPLIKDCSSTPSKEELLLLEREEEENSSSSSKNVAQCMPLSSKDEVIFGRKYEEQRGEESGKPKEEISGKNEQKHDRKHEFVKHGNIKDMKITEGSEFEDALTDAYNDDDCDDDKEDEDGRMIGHDDDRAFPGSPSFRVYFKDDGEDKHNDLGKTKKNALKSTISSDDNTIPSKESSDQNKKVKRGRKKKTFRKVLPKGGQAAVKNLLSVKSCYTPSPSSAHHQSHLRIRKTMA